MTRAWEKAIDTFFPLSLCVLCADDSPGACDARGRAPFDFARVVVEDYRVVRAPANLYLKIKKERKKEEKYVADLILWRVWR